MQDAFGSRVHEEQRQIFRGTVIAVDTRDQPAKVADWIGLVLQGHVGSDLRSSRLEELARGNAEYADRLRGDALVLEIVERNGAGIDQAGQRRPSQFALDAPLP